MIMNTTSSYTIFDGVSCILLLYEGMRMTFDV